MVPPVWPSPRPLIIGTARPAAATIGASSRLTLSPTPPVECLSILGFATRSWRRTRPESRIASVSAVVSAAVMPRRHTAIRNAPSCASPRLPSVTPDTRSWISSALSARPSRFFAISRAGGRRIGSGRDRVPERLHLDERLDPQQRPQLLRVPPGGGLRLAPAHALTRIGGGDRDGAVGRSRRQQPVDVAV